MSADFYERLLERDRRRIEVLRDAVVKAHVILTSAAINKVELQVRLAAAMETALRKDDAIFEEEEG